MPVVSVVPPTWVILVLSDGKSIVPVKASESPVALKKDWPWAPIVLKTCSDAASTPPPPHEQLS